MAMLRTAQTLAPTALMTTPGARSWGATLYRAATGTDTSDGVVLPGWAVCHGLAWGRSDLWCCWWRIVAGLPQPACVLCCKLSAL